MNLFRSIAAVVGTLGVALAAGSLFQPAPEPESAANHSPDGLPEGASASLAGTFTDAIEPALAFALPAPRESSAVPATSLPPQAAEGQPMMRPLASLRLLARAARQMPAPPAMVISVGNRDATAEAATTTTPEPFAATEECGIWLVATPVPQAMLDISLYAPCDGGARVEIRHEVLHVSQTLGDDGQLMLALPALAEAASVSVTLVDGRSAEASAAVPDIALFDRLALGWQGADALALNAHVDGAGHGVAGHVHPAHPNYPADSAQNGFLTLLGDPALEEAALAQIYTFPAGLGAASGHVELAVEAAITPQSCGEEISAQTRLFRAGQPATPRQLSMTMPACDGFEGFLVIDGLIPELTLAQN
ncbi:MAG: hypothetical protein JJT95_06205 [Pararhodobacter sp.]|nr:hypothetical protein [Pararhodobacter sp.]